MRGEDTDSLYTHVSAEQESDEANLMQLPQPLALAQLPDELSAMLKTLNSDAWVECEEEGPVGYIETWFLTGQRPCHRSGSNH